MGTPIRTFRVDDELWSRAQAAAEVEGRDVSSVVRAALERFARRVERAQEEDK